MDAPRCESADLIVWLIIIILAFATAYHGAHWCHEYRMRRQAEARLGVRAQVTVTMGLLMRVARSPAHELAPWIARLPLRSIRTPVATWLRWAGRPVGVTADHLIAQSLIIAVVAAVLGGWGAPLAPGWCALGAGSIGAVVPWHWLHSLSAKRRRALAAQLPGVLDLLALSTQAGLDLPGAVARIGELLPAAPLVDELQLLHRELRMGSSQAQAWHALAIRCGVDSISRFVALLSQTMRLGTPLAHLLKVEAARQRGARFYRAERQGAIASQKILLPIVVCIMPAYFFLTFGGIVALFVTDGWKGFVG